MKVSNMTNRNGKTIPNQFIIEDCGELTFQSYKSIIVRRYADGKIVLDSIYWDYSRTTGKYRNLFLGESKKETEQKIKDGVYQLVNLF